MVRRLITFCIRGTGFSSVSIVCVCVCMCVRVHVCVCALSICSVLHGCGIAARVAVSVVVCVTEFVYVCEKRYTWTAVSVCASVRVCCVRVCVCVMPHS